MISISSDLGRRLGLVAALLFTSAGATASSAAFIPPGVSHANGWETSNASTFAAEPCLSRERVLERALAEVRSTRGVMSLSELVDESALQPYLNAVDEALNHCELHLCGTRDIATFATALEMARATLQQQVTSLGSWLAIVRVLHPDLPRYATVPPRFQAKTSTSVLREHPPTREDIAAIFEFDAVLGV